MGIKIGVQVIITVHHADQFSPSLFQRPVPGQAGTAVFLVNHPDTIIFFRPLVADLPAPVGGPIIHQQDLQVGIGLLRNGADTGIQIGLHIINRNHNAEQRQCFHKYPRQCCSSRRNTAT